MAALPCAETALGSSCRAKEKTRPIGGRHGGIPYSCTRERRVHFTQFRRVGAAAAGHEPHRQEQPAASKQDPGLRPHPTPPVAAPVEKLPLDKIKLPAGFRAEVWSSGHPGARTMVRGDKGTIFMGTRGIGRVYAIVDKDGKREARPLIQGLTQPNGLAFKDGALYVFAINRVFRYDGIEDKLDNPGEPVELTKAFNLPPEIHHNWKYVDFGPDGKLYVQVGANCNVCELNPASMRRSAVTTRTARAWRSSRAACATPSDSTGIR